MATPANLERTSLDVPNKNLLTTSSQKITQIGSADKVIKALADKIKEFIKGPILRGAIAGGILGAGIGAAIGFGVGAIPGLVIGTVLGSFIGLYAISTLVWYAGKKDKED